ncbi:MAG: hypothetical protein EP301_03580 [Gammaproteobacteria bacterium]|jgi:hypothetical protein|nr:MAG: hypothetical protein EP301_03580 [Gammaproteobacteria bacterium]
MILDHSNHTGSRQPERRILRALIAAVLLLAGGCALLPQPEVLEPAESQPPEAMLAPESATHYRITKADLEIHTYRAGWLSHLAHNHIMETDQIRGSVHLAEPIEDSTAHLYFRPWDLELDDPDARDAAGTGFESERTAEDIAATRTRMLGPKGFDSNKHPWVVIAVRWKDRNAAGLLIEFRDGSYAFDVPLQWSFEAGVLTAAADFELSHRALGIRPYSAFAGAIAVADPIRIQLTLSARPDSSI